ncbi:PREDICTED: uncharacterized protein LOC109169908 [Ipomoea nil]|uniref:uncharacterized protein LOC109169908 n=1 Tax=Ipomoea nil TaxID=35883 RepID=UPI000901A932|nr:PREDICTED: uncharacterized protein LOC109169908 [Ipomoea nil]
MNLITGCHFKVRYVSPDISVSKQISTRSGDRFSRVICRHSHRLSFLRRRTHHLSSLFRPYQCIYNPCRPLIASARKRNSKSEPILSPSIVEQVLKNDDEDEDKFLAEDFEDEELLEDDNDDDFFYDESFEEDAKLFFGDGSGGGGIALAGTPWDKKALEIAEEVALSFDGELGIYAFKTQKNAHIEVRVERLTNKSGSPSMADIEAFSSAYRARLDEAESLGSIPNNLSLEVSSPGVERVVRVPEDLDRFKERPMYVKYVSEGIKSGMPTEHDGVFRLESFDLETSVCTWGLADVRVNREKAGKGRPLSKKQREWRLDTPFDSLLMVRLHSEM